MSEDINQSVNENPLKKAEFGLGGIILGLLFVAVVLLMFNYLNLISLPFSFLKQTKTVQDVITTTKSSENSITFQSLISKDKTIEDVRVAITPEGREITEPINVSDKLQKEFQKIHPGEKILYLGKDNKGPKDSLIDNELNDSIVTVGGLKSENESEIKFIQYGGTLLVEQSPKDEKGKQEVITVFPQIVMKFKDIVLIPGSKDFYVHGIDPINNNADIYVRIVRDADGKFEQTVLQCFDLNNIDGINYNILDENKDKHLASGIAPEKFFPPGDTIEFFTATKLSDVGDVKKVTFVVDENKKQTARLGGIIRRAGVDEINSLFR